MLPIGSRARRWNGCARWMGCAACISRPMLLLENKDFREFIALLNSNAVRFLIVGGHAVTFHGCPRFTADLDLWVESDAENALRVNQSLKGFGFGNLFKADDFSKPGYAIQLGRPPYRIDILTSIQGVDFAKAYARRKTLKADGMKLPFIGLDELLVNKRAVGRLHDLDDAAKLAAGLGRKAKESQTARAGKPKKN
jgi:predicted nucleotidyltransferase